MGVDGSKSLTKNPVLLFGRKKVPYKLVGQITFNLNEHNLSQAFVTQL